MRKKLTVWLLIIVVLTVSLALSAQPCLAGLAWAG
jgi:hypothetical protein